MKKGSTVRQKPGCHIKTDLLDKEFNDFLDAVRRISVEKEDLTGSIKEFVTVPQAFLAYEKHFGKEALALTSIQHRIRIALKEEKYPEDLIYLDDEVKIGKNKIFINRLNKILMRELFLPHADPIPEGIDKDLQKLDEVFRSSWGDGEFGEEDDVWEFGVRNQRKHECFLFILVTLFNVKKTLRGAFAFIFKKYTISTLPFRERSRYCMNNRKPTQHFPKVPNLFMRLASLVLVFSFLMGPLLPVFAQEAMETTESTEIPTEKTDTEKSPESTPEQEPEKLPKQTEEQDDGKDKEGEEVDPEMRTAGASSLPNSPREVSPMYRDRIVSEIDTLTGSLIYKYKINVPPGRNSITTPSVSLVYNSADAAKDSMVGLGWSIDIPYIERMNKTGVQNLYSEDYYASSLSGELVSTGTGTYEARSEDGDFLKYTKNTNGWTVLDKNGTTYTFGLNAQARQDNSADTTKIYGWFLEEVRDTNNNYISYEYYKDTGQVYPSKITYTGNGSTAGVMTVNFARESRTGAPKNYSAGFLVQSNYRINEIRTEINNTWAHKYTLAYTAADSSVTALLNTITESGQDESSNITTLPAIDFDYQTSTVGWTYSSTHNLPIEVFDSSDKGARMADLNGDGLQDLICYGAYNNAPCGWNNNAAVYINTGTGWTNASGSWGPPYPFVTSMYKDTGVRLVDVNGDSIIDFVRADGSVNQTYLGNGASWTLDTSWVLPLPFIDGSGDYGMRMADVNGDGLPDILCASTRTRGYTSCRKGDERVYLNTGSGWQYTSAVFQLPTRQDDSAAKEVFAEGNYVADSGLRIIDVNGDGLSDLVRASADKRYFYINNGSSFIYDSSWNTLPGPFVNNSLKDVGGRMADFNGDGYPDYLCNNPINNEYCGKNNIAPKGMGTGTGFTSTGWDAPSRQDIPSQPETFVDSSYADRGIRLVDVNGDTLPDLVRATSSNKYTYINNTTRQANYLTKITYPEGGNTTITYKPTTQYLDGSGNLLNPNLPAVYTVVSKISDDDGVTPVVRNYEYSGGRYYFNGYMDRKFAGFGKITTTDAAGNITKTYYHQGSATDTSGGEYDDHSSKIGKVYRTEEYDNSGNLYRLTVNKWDKYNIGTNHDFVKLVRATTLTYDGDSDHADTAVEYAYDNTYGNLIAKTDWGKVTASTDGSFSDTGTDKSVETISYVANTGNYVVGLPYQNTVVDQSSNKVRESRIYYDTLSLGSVGAGNPTKVENWITGSTYASNQKAYNTTYGIVTSETDPRGKVTSYSYDSYHLYPATVTDPLTHTTQYVYDYSLGKPKQVTDQNGFLYQTVYDGLDRVLEEKIPGPVTKTSYSYTDTANAVAVHKTDHLDGSTAVETYQYFDGLGRLIQERKEAESNYNVRDIAYNNRGLTLKESLPYSDSGSSKTSATAASSLYTNYTYDALQRPLTVSNALGTTSYVYDDWKTSVTDAESNTKQYYNDARQNLIQVDEENNSATYTTTYEWNLNNKLTKITDALGNLRNFTYDGLGRRLTAQDLHASGDGTFGTWSYSYDDAGNLTQSISPNSATTNYTYNDINQQLTEDYTGAGGTEISYTYSGCTNGTGKLCSVAMTAGANTAYTYTSAGNIASETKTINSTGYTTSYTYDRQGNTLTITHPDSAETKYTFNTGGLLEKIERKESGGSYTDVVSNFNYNPVNQPTTIAFPNTVTTTNTYDSAKLYRLTRRLTQNTVPTKLQDLNYTYDDVGNITQIVDASNTDAAKTVNYEYDDLYRLTSATATNTTNSSNYAHTYVYNAIGNLTSGPIGTYAYAGTGYANPHAATSVNSVTHSYDNDGNLTGNGSLATTWNYKDQLTQAIVGAVTSTYAYDHAGARVSLANGTTTTAYPNKYYNADSTGKKTKQIYAGDQLVATIETASSVVSPYYDHTDQLGSVTAVSDGTGAQVETLDYFPYGNQRISTGTYTGQRQYIGQLYDTDTGLDYLNARYYDGGRGQFLSQDPVFWEVGQSKESMSALSDPQSMNSYSYAGNNPIRNSDPDGRWYKEVLTGQQSWSSFYGEVGEATQYMGSGWQTAMDHPVAAGAAIGVGSGLAVYAGAAGLTALSTQYLGGAGTACVALCNQNGQKLAEQGISNLQQLPRVVSATEKMVERGSNVGIKGINNFLQQAQKGTAYLDKTTGNINIFSKIGDTAKYTRTTLNPEGNKIISAGINTAKNVLNGISKGRFTPISK